MHRDVCTQSHTHREAQGWGHSQRHPETRECRYTEARTKTRADVLPPPHRGRHKCRHVPHAHTAFVVLRKGDPDPQPEQKYSRSQTHPAFRHSHTLWTELLEKAPETNPHTPLPGVYRVIPQETCPGVQGTSTQPCVKSCLELEHIPTGGSPDCRSVGSSSHALAHPGLQTGLNFPSSL